ncbi:hypothetical protein [Komagataeibacter sp. SM21]
MSAISALFRYASARSGNAAWAVGSGKAGSRYRVRIMVILSSADAAVGHGMPKGENHKNSFFERNQCRGWKIPAMFL